MQRAWRIIWQAARKHGMSVMTGIVMLLLIAWVSLLPPLTMKAIVDNGIAGRDVSLLARLTLRLVGLYLTIAILDLAANAVFMRMSVSMMQEIRSRVFRRVIGLPLSFLEQRHTGYIAARLGEVSALGAMFGIESFRMIVAIVEFIGALAISLRMNVRLTVAMLCLLPIYWLLVRGVSGGYRRSLHEVAETGGRLSGKLHETLDGISEVKNLGAEEQRAGDVICASEELARATMRQGRIAVWAGQGLSVVGSLASALAVYVAGRSIVAGDFTFGGYTAFVAYMGKLFAPIGRISGFGFVVQPSLTALERLSEFLDESTEDERYSHLPAPACMAEVEFEDVVFSYPANSGRPALNGVSLVLESPGSVAVVGPNGSGKSTLIKLLLGYYTDYSGRIRIDGQDLRELNVLEIRRLVGVVAQDPFLFDGTVADNLELAANGRMGGFAGRTGSIDQAVRQNRVLERLLSRLPEGLATKVGEGGRNLSGGQRQTVAIARAFLRCARIVVFDEATAHLDSEAHAVVEEAVQELFSDRLCIVLTHDPGLARTARQRVRMDQGRVVDID